MKKPSFINILLIISIMGWCFLIIIPPFIVQSGSFSFEQSKYFYKPFSTICHQYENRSFHIFGYKLAVCARCTGIYFGYFLGTILVTFITIKLWCSYHTVWLIAISPILVDVLFDIFRIHQATLITRFVTGFIFGSVAAIILTPLIIEAFNKKYYKTILRSQS